VTGDLGGVDIFFVSVRGYFCTKKECYLNKNGGVLFRDRNHLNIGKMLIFR